VASSPPRSTAAFPVAPLPLRVAVAAGAPPAATVRRPLYLGRHVVVIPLSGAAWWGVQHFHESHRAAAAAGSVLAHPVLEPACASWANLGPDARAGADRVAVSAQATAARTAFEQARGIDRRAGLDDAVSALAFLDALQEPAQAGASNHDVAHAVSVVSDACRPYQ